MKPNELGGRTFQGGDDILPLQWATDACAAYPGFQSEAHFIGHLIEQSGDELILDAHETQLAYELLEDYGYSPLPHSPFSLSCEKRQVRQSVKLHRKAARQVLKRALAA